MSKPKGGLQKKVSSIFDGVPLDAEAARGSTRPSTDSPAAPAAAPLPKASVSAAPRVDPQSVKLNVPPAPTVWPKPPTAHPEQPAQPRFEPKPPVSPAQTPEAAPGTSNRPAAPPRPAQPAADKPAARPAPRVVVKQTGPGNDKKKNLMLVGGLAVIFIVAVLWSTGLLSGVSTTPPELSSTQEVPATQMVKIEWQRPSLPLPSRNPMRFGSSGSPSQPISGSSSFLNVMAVYCSQDKAFALIDGAKVEVGETIRGAKITAITQEYVEYQLEGVTTKEYVHGGAKNNQTGSTDVKPETNTNLN